MLEHQSRIRLKVAEAPLVEHFLSAGHKEDDFFHTVLHVGRSKGKDLLTELLKTEVYWIHRLGTISPAGMNISLDLSCYL